MKKIKLFFIALFWCANMFAQSGSNDSTFNTFDIGSLGDDSGFGGQVRTAALQPDGKIIVGGGFATYDGITKSCIARLNTNGSLDASFNSASVIGDFGDFVNTMVVQPDGKIIVGGNFNYFNGITRSHIVRLNADGSLDTTFNPGSGFNNWVRIVTLQPDGKIIVGGGFTTFNGTTCNTIVCLNTDGSVDTTSFNIGSGFNNSINTVVLQPDGKIIFGGEFSSINGIQRNRIARVNADGSLDTTFNLGTGANDEIYSATMQNDGKILIGGDFTHYNGVVRSRIARLNADGSLDSAFISHVGLNNPSFYPVVNTTSVQSDGKILIGGSFNEYNSTEKNCFARLNADGVLDTTFISGIGFNGSVNFSIKQSDGKIIVVGVFSSFNEITQNGIARLNTDGSLDLSFDHQLSTGFSNDVYASALQSDGKVIFGGNFTSFNGTTRNRIARLNTAGTLDATFNPGTGFNDVVWSIALQSDGKIIVGGSFTTYNGTPINSIARLNVDGTLDASFSSGTGVDNEIKTISIQSDGKIILGGSFTTFNGTAINYIARLNVDGSLDATFNPSTGFNYYVQSTVLQPDGKIIVGGDFSSFNGTTRNKIARLNTDGTLDATFNPVFGFDRQVNTVALQPDGKIIAGGRFTIFDLTQSKGIARLNTDGSLDDTFISIAGAEGANGEIYTTAIQNDGKILIGGDFYSYNGTVKNDFARLNPNGSLDVGFNTGSGFSNGVWSIILQSDGKIVAGGDFTKVNGKDIYRIVRINTDGSVDNTYNPDTGFDGNVYSTALQSDGKIIVGGSFTLFNRASINRIARLNSDGSLDATFNPGIGFNNLIYSITLQSDGKIIVGGNFTSFNGVAINRIARLNSDGSLDATFNPGTGFNSDVYTITLQLDGKIIVGGNSASFNGTTINRIVRLNSDGSLDATFNPGTGFIYTVYSTAIQIDGKIIVGNGTAVSTRIARLNIDGSIDTTFNPGTGFNNVVRSIALQPDGKIIVAGDFSGFNGTGRGKIARLNSDGSLDTTFNPPGTGFLGYVYSTVLQIGGKIIVGGNFSSFNGTARKNIARLNSDGSLDLTFNPGTGFNNYVYSTSLQLDEKIIVGGSFDLFNFIPRNRIARLNTSCVPPAPNGFSTQTFCDSSTVADLSATGTNIQWYDAATGGVLLVSTTPLANNTNYFASQSIDGCESEDRLEVSVTIANSTLSTDVVTACDSITWIDGNTYTSNTTTPTFTIIGGAVTGCDSIVTLNLTINNSTSSTDIITACDSITWLDGNTYTVSTNTPTYILTNVSGCDSIVTLNLAINNTSTSTDIITACDSVTWIDGNTYTSSTTTPTFTIVGGSSTGCDSVVTLNLTISPIDISVVSNPYTIVAVESGATYQWLDCNNGNAIISGETNQTYIPASSGNYAVVVSKNGCVDTSACVNFCNIEANYLFSDNGNGNYTFTNATSGNYTQSHWAFGDGTTSTATNPNHTFTVNNTFAVVLTVNDSTTVSSCMGYYIDVITVTGVVSPLQCVAGFTMYADTNNINVILNATGTNLTYLWDFGDGDTSNAQFPSHTYATTGNYYLCLSIDDGAGCVDMYCDSIGENGVVFNKQTGFTINVIAPPLATQVNEQVTLTSGVAIYPNPTTAEFIIELASFSPKTQLSIVSVEGKTVYTTNTINTNKIVINAADWSKGIYMVKITDKQSSQVVKLVKQ